MPMTRRWEDDLIDDAPTENERSTAPGKVVQLPDPETSAAATQANRELELDMQHFLESIHEQRAKEGWLELTRPHSVLSIKRNRKEDSHLLHGIVSDGI